MIRELSDADLIAFAMAGCNAAEIAAYAGVSEATAKAMLAHARVVYARAA